MIRRYVNWREDGTELKVVERAFELWKKFLNKDPFYCIKLANKELPRDKQRPIKGRHNVKHTLELLELRIAAYRTAQAPPVVEPAVPKAIDLEGINSTLTEILGVLREIRNDFRAAWQPESAPVDISGITAKPTEPAPPRKKVLVVGLKGDQPRILKSKIDKDHKLYFLDSESTLRGTFPSADIVLMSRHTNHSLEEQLHSRFGNKVVWFPSTSIDKIAERINSL